MQGTRRVWLVGRGVVGALALLLGAASLVAALPSSVDVDRDGFLDGIEDRLGSDKNDATKTPEHLAVEERCLDGLDNDGDGRIDLDDPGCQAADPAKVSFPDAGEDAFDSRLDLKGYPLQTSGFGTCTVDVNAAGPTVVRRSAPSTGGDGRRFFDTEMLAMQLTGQATIMPGGSCTLPSGVAVPITIFEDPMQATTGQVKAKSPGADFPADSFFDVFFDIDTPVGVLTGGPPGGPEGDPVHVTNNVDDGGGLGTIPPYHDQDNPLCYQVQGLPHKHCPKAPADHFKCYSGKFTPPFGRMRGVTLRDQFGQKDATVLPPAFFCNPASKNAEPLFNKADHLKCYRIKPERLKPARVVTIRNQFGVRTMAAKRAEMLCVPSGKDGKAQVGETDHYKCYSGKFTPGASLQRSVILGDQWVPTAQHRVLKPRFLCNPVSKKGEGIRDPNRHLECFAINPIKVRNVSATVTNQFGTEQVRVRRSELLCVPSTKLEGATTTTTLTPTSSTTTTTLCLTPPCAGRAVTAQGNQVICLADLGGPSLCIGTGSECASPHLHGDVTSPQTIQDPLPNGCGHGPVGPNPQCQGRQDSVPHC